MLQAIGVIETHGFPASLAAADAMVKAGQVSLFCQAGYVATFHISYVVNGKRKFHKKDASSGVTVKHNIPSNASDVKLTVEAHLGLGNSKNFNYQFKGKKPNQIKAKYKCWGTIFDPQCSKI